jgi:hypothetical protein
MCIFPQRYGGFQATLWSCNRQHSRENQTQIAQNTNSRKNLFQNETAENPCNKRLLWSQQETKVLVQFICLFAENASKNKWPSNKNQEFWTKCAETVNKTCGTNRTGRTKGK